MISMSETIARRPMLDPSRRAEGFAGQRIVVLPRNVVTTMLKAPLISRLIPTDIGFFPMAHGHLFERERGVDQAIFIYCTKGRGWCEERNQRHEVSAGDLLVIPPNEPHSYGADD